MISPGPKLTKQRASQVFGPMIRHETTLHPEEASNQARGIRNGGCLFLYKNTISSLEDGCKQTTRPMMDG